MAQTATNIRTFFQDNYKTAQARVEEIAEQWSVTEMVEKIRAGDLKLREDLLQQFGLVNRSQLDELEGLVKDLKAQLATTKKELKGIKKELAAAKKNVVKRAAAAKKVAKKTKKSVVKAATEAAKKA